MREGERGRDIDRLIEGERDTVARGRERGREREGEIERLIDR